MRISQTIPYVETDGGRRSTDIGDSTDCTVRAAALAMGAPYAEMHARFAALGRKPYHAFCFATFADSIGIAGTLGRGTVARFIQTHPVGRYVVRIKNGRIGHVFAVIDGAIYDAFPTNPRARVRSFWFFGGAK